MERAHGAQHAPGLEPSTLLIANATHTHTVDVQGMADFTSFGRELLQEIMKQKAACNRIIGSKDSLIKEFQAELKGKDEEYVKALKRQADDIEELLKRMTEQYKTLHKSYRAELDTIEDEFKAERAELLSSNKGELDQLFDKRRKMEMEFLEAKLEREEKYQNEVHLLGAHTVDTHTHRVYDHTVKGC